MNARRSPLAPLFLALACGGDSNGDDGAASVSVSVSISTTVSTTAADETSHDGSATSTSTTAATTSQEEGGEMPPPPPPPTTGGEETSGADSTSADTGPPTCSTNADCGTEEICIDNQCLYAQFETYRVTVDSWDVDCGTFNEPDLFWQLWVGYAGPGGYVHASATIGCPGTWDGPACLTPAELPVFFDLWDDDPVGSPDFVDQLCWVEGQYCSLIPTEILRDGFYDGPTSYGDVHITFEWVAACP